MRAKGAVVVIDTNVWISGLLTPAGHPGQLTRHAVLSAQPAFSRATFAEIEDRLWRPKFDRYVTMELRKRFMSDLASIALWVDVPAAMAAKTFCRDAADDKFIHAALAAGAPWLVSGDKDLLALAQSLSPLGLSVLSPADAATLWALPG